MRVLLLLLLAACDAHPSRLDAIVVTHGPDPTPRPRGARPIGEPRAENRDERDRDLDRKLREVASRDVPDDTASGGVSLASVLGSTPGPFGSLAAIKPGMTRTELLAALPTAQRDGELVWIPTGIDGVAVELAFDRTERLAEIVYHVPLAARPLLVGAWGAPAHETNVWFDPTRGWRARLGEDPVNGKIELAIAPYRPFADVIGRGPVRMASATRRRSSAPRSPTSRADSRGSTRQVPRTPSCCCPPPTSAPSQRVSSRAPLTVS
ncbi:MAG: hypothetical protein H0T89_12180 [Deltaproteobacteria bacterium]|nr:hypothetical protein [Deltaproteobacteria bacterium]